LAACEAAAAVRLARQVSEPLAENVVEWLWTNQRQLSRELIFRTAEQEFKLQLAPAYDALLASIAAEAESAGRASVSGTPAYFLNGRKLPLLSAQGLAAAIDLEIGQLAASDSVR
jgi:protein-disulfide isomerase